MVGPAEIWGICMISQGGETIKNRIRVNRRDRNEAEAFSLLVFFLVMHVPSGSLDFSQDCFLCRQWNKKEKMLQAGYPSMH